MQATIDLKITDPVYKKDAAINPVQQYLLQFINDKRDLPFLRLCLIICCTTIPAAIYFFVTEDFNWWIALIYFLFNAIFLMGSYILMLHNTSHRGLFKRKYNFLNKVIPWVLGPFFGETPESYFAHHVGMHHPENNLSEDLSSTMKYQRDSFRDFLRYFLRFFIFVIADLSVYLKRKGRNKIRQKFLSGEFTWYVIVAILLYFNWQATFVVFVFPLIFTRFMMMAGNWGQHAFIDRATPANCYRNSITCINSPYNKQCFNDGYHIGHHLNPSMHWTDMPVNFKENISNYAKENAIVFRKLDFSMVWFLLMTKSYGTLAKYYVDLSPAQPKSKMEIIALLKERTRKIETDAD